MKSGHLRTEPVLRPKWLYLNDSFVEEHELVIDEKRGTIIDLRPVDPERSSRGVIRLPDQALLPGLCNAHSHAFQRMLRGLTQEPRNRKQKGANDFWSWREEMYRTA